MTYIPTPSTTVVCRKAQETLLSLRHWEIHGEIKCAFPKSFAVISMVNQIWQYMVLPLRWSTNFSGVYGISESRYQAAAFNCQTHVCFNHKRQNKYNGNQNAFWFSSFLHGGWLVVISGNEIGSLLVYFYLCNRKMFKYGSKKPDLSH